MSDAATVTQSNAARAAAARPYLIGLNDAQREAVETTEGPLLVLAGAGTGKTRVLTTRLAHILMTRGVFPSQVLAVTFTNKAAREMAERVARLVGPASEGLWIGTFHAIATRILRRHAELVGLKSNFTILDQDDQIRLLKQLLQAADIDDKRWPARAIHAVIQRWKDRGLTPGKVNADDAGEFAAGRAVELYRAYQDRLLAVNACDFGDLLLHGLTLFTQNPDVLADYQRRFKYLLVDEYQDTNVAQYLWLRLLARHHGNICCVGDDDQSIYSWRGAEVGNILRFEKDFEGAKIIRLEQNYRSTKPILAAASGLIANNAGRLGKTLWTDRDGGHKVRLRGVWDAESEARLICEEIEAHHHRDGGSLDEVAVLVRASFQMREFEERFVTLGMSYRVVGGPRFYERQEIRDALAYLRLINQPDDDLAFERIVNLPRRGIGAATLQIVHMVGRSQAVPLLEASRRLVETDELKPQARSALRGFVDDVDRWRVAAESGDHVELAEMVLDESGYTKMWQDSKVPDGPGRLDNLRELVDALDEFENLAGFLEHISLVMEREETGNGERVSLMTLHAAKGLEFDVVFLPGWEEEVFPNRRSVDEGGAAALEEERRLAYVGLTRARKRAMVTFAANRRIHNQWLSCVPSRFIDELPADEVEIETETGMYGPAAHGAYHASEDLAQWPEVSAGRGPGYQRLQRARQKGGSAPLLEGRAVDVSPNRGGIAVGVRVFHQKFGYGAVIAVEGNKLQIDFEKAGVKKVFSDYVEPA